MKPKKLGLPSEMGGMSTKATKAQKQLEEDEKVLELIEDLENREFSPAVKKKILGATLFALCVGNMMI